ncbi:hypothetical protein ACH5RR_012500 [Cinchona calisaya]|uniref:Uncharacterized protein n=1 Tax=Cinchona calisaya TaxID=153742 RepID=A0ABD3A7Z9_9GENT
MVARHRLQSTGFEPGSLVFCPHKEYAFHQLGCSSICERRTPCEDKRPRTQVRIPSTAVGAGQPWSWYNNTLSSGSYKGDVTKKGAFFVPSNCLQFFIRMSNSQSPGLPLPERVTLLTSLTNLNSFQMSSLSNHYNPSAARNNFLLQDHMGRLNYPEIGSFHQL